MLRLSGASLESVPLLDPVFPFLSHTDEIIRKEIQQAAGDAPHLTERYLQERDTQLQLLQICQQHIPCQHAQMQ